MERGGASYKYELGPGHGLKAMRDARDDWTGKACAKERRKLQNRLHQREWRRKKAAERAAVEARRGHGSSTGFETEDIALAFEQATAAFVPSHRPMRTGVQGPTTTTSTSTLVPLNLHDLMAVNLQSQPREASPDTTSPSSSLSSKDKAPPAVVQFWETQLHSGPPATSIPFPLAPDHYLLTLIQYNVLRGLITNIVLCSGFHHIDPECQLTFTLAQRRPAMPPSNFRPTALQLETEHPYWIDSVPCAQLRDNLITASVTKDSRFDTDALCDDMCGGLYDGIDDCEKRGMLLWGEPWRTESWEMSEGFLEKWGWLMKGCGEMVDATNRWRDVRGEERLVVEVE